ncbi:uncharacterized protein LOC117471940 isoform X2 [Trematomus bernacchii]|uniref:uncharacterized protein LOC117471940 isoform X2 n=1 Tax=Trematomus bernacchii TaxID=40690 RepID=UPI00146F61CA|nr:uncharacterized protein LOC117471940 isoform X2 [Trematomus bernacchii]
MVEFRRINTTLVVILLLQFTAVTGQNSSLTVRAGHSVTLPCEHVIKHQHKCDSTTWLHSQYERATVIELINLGQIGRNGIPKAKSDRLSVTENCSLFIKNVTPEDAGRYSCRQYNRSGQKQQGADFVVLLSVINMTQDKQNDMITLFCAVSTYGECKHTVKWVYEGNQSDVEITPTACSSRVRFASHLDQNLLKCNVTDPRTGETLLCDAGPKSSCQQTGSTSRGINVSKGPVEMWWWYIVAAVGLAALLIVIVAVIRWKKTKGDRPRMDDRIGHNPAVTQPGPENTADREEDVSYASVSYSKNTSSKNTSSKNTSSKAQGQSKEDDEEDDLVTYSTVKAPSSSSSAGASADPSSLYATVNKPTKEAVTVTAHVETLISQ